jgi:hypothetical protein
VRSGPRYSLAAALAALALLGGLTGCAKVSGTMVPNRAPETTVWVTGELDTVAHTQRFFWDGQDPDGVVVGFAFRWLYQPGAEPEGYDPAVWTFTDRRDSVFAVWSPNGVDFPTLEVRAVDDVPDGVVDADSTDYGTADPSAASQRFTFSNLAPEVALSSTPPPQTLPVASFSWFASDPDGDARLARFRVWLDGRPDQDTLVTGSGITLPAYFFAETTGEILARQRTMYVTAIDVGGCASEPDSFSWFVQPPAGSTLLVDEMPGATFYDNFYRGELTARLGDGQYSVIDLEQGAYFPTADAIRETFYLFEHVFWCAENNPNLSPNLALADQPIRDYLSAGGNLYLAGSRVVGTGGALEDGFARDVLGTLELRVNQLNGTTGFVISPGQFLIGGQSPFDSLQSTGIWAGVESFVLADPADAMYLAPPGTLDTLHVDDWPVAVNRRYGAEQGRMVYLCFPLRGMNSSFSGLPGRSATELRKIFDLFGM